jgi:hypothetical protein
MWKHEISAKLSSIQTICPNGLTLTNNIFFRKKSPLIYVYKKKPIQCWYTSEMKWKEKSTMMIRPFIKPWKWWPQCYRLCMYHGEGKNTIIHVWEKKFKSPKTLHNIFSGIFCFWTLEYCRPWKITNLRDERKIKHPECKNIWSRWNNKTDYQKSLESALKSYVVPAVLWGILNSVELYWSSL